MEFVSKEQYQAAQKKIEIYEKRQEKLAEVKQQIANILSTFKPEDFEFRFIKNEIIFVANDEGNLRIGVAHCEDMDVYNKDLGKLIAIRKAFGESIKDLIELVEPKCKESNISFTPNSIVTISPYYGVNIRN